MNKLNANWKVLATPLSVSVTAKADIAGARLLRRVSENGAYLLSLLMVCQDVATEKVKHGVRPPSPRGPIPKSATPKQRMQRKLRTKKGRETYARRKTSVEPVFGQIKDARGIRRFLLRGIEAVRAEWRLICLTHNLLKLFRAKSAPAT